MRTSLIVLVGLVAGILSLVECGGGSHKRTDSSGDATTTGASTAGEKPVASGATVARCQIAIGGQGTANWRKYSTYVGPVGFFGPERRFRHVVGHIVKTPVVVEGRRAVTLAIAPSDQDHAGLLIVGDPHPYAEVRFIPCRDHMRTAWPAGFKLPGNELVRAPVLVLVRVGGRPVGKMEVGRQ